jgi:hypothetical protein
MKPVGKFNYYIVLYTRCLQQTNSKLRGLSPRANKLVDRGVLRSQCGGSPTALNLIFWTGAATFSFK